jgi:hypothetical protein
MYKKLIPIITFLLVIILGCKINNENKLNDSPAKAGGFRND